MQTSRDIEVPPQSRVPRGVLLDSVCDPAVHIWHMQVRFGVTDTHHMDGREPMNFPPGLGLQHRDAADLMASLGPGIYCRAWSADSEGRALSGLDATCSYCGITLDQYRDIGWLSIYHPDDRAGLEANWTRCLRTNEPYIHHHRVRRAD